MDEKSVQNTSEQSTTTTQEETPKEEIVESELAFTPQEKQDDNNNSVQDDTQKEAQTDDFLEIQYNHKKMGISKQEAVTLAQKGIHFQNTYDTLERVATLKGQTVKEFLVGIETAQDENYRQGLIEKFGNDSDTVEKMMELYNIKKQQTLSEAKQDNILAERQKEQSQITGLQEEFMGMKKGDFPELTNFNDLPDQVKSDALNGMSLSHAYLLYMYKQNKKIEAAKQSQKASAMASVGSMGSTVQEDGLGEAFLKGLFG